MKDRVGLLTPEATLRRAGRLNNAWQMLWRGAPPKQKKMLDPLMAGYLAYFNDLRLNWSSRMTEWGELEAWEKRYERARQAVATAGGKMRNVPVIVPVAPPASSFALGMGSGLGVALVGVGAFWLLTRGRR